MIWLALVGWFVAAYFGLRAWCRDIALSAERSTREAQAVELDAKDDVLNALVPAGRLNATPIRPVSADDLRRCTPMPGPLEPPPLDAALTIVLPNKTQAIPLALERRTYTPGEFRGRETAGALPRFHVPRRPRPDGRYRLVAVDVTDGGDGGEDA